MVNEKFTKASTFVRCWIGFSNEFYNGFFYNCYISIEPEKTIHIILKKPIENNKEFSDIMDSLRSNRHYREENESGALLIIDFNIPEDKEEDFDNFILGKYSKFSETTKELIIMSHADIRNIKSLASILYPTQKHRDELSKKLDFDLPSDAEIHSKPDMVKEIFTKNNLNA